MSSPPPPSILPIEPVPDNLPGPFQLKPLAGAISTDALGRNNDIGNQTTATFPTGTGLLMSALAVEVASWSRIKAHYR